ARSVRGSNGIRIRIREFLRAHDDPRIILELNGVSTNLPTRRHTRRQRLGVLSDSGRRKTSTSRLKTRILGKTPYLEPLLFLDLPQKVAGSG
ncbi:hypothetical protein GBA52_008213, partial [Prunus armeniaca]